jgi:quercetin dioxygenase-like cupin family protein
MLLNFFPKIVASVNDHYVKIVKIKGDDVQWHNHDDSDELFYVLKGSLVKLG